MSAETDWIHTYVFECLRCGRMWEHRQLRTNKPFPADPDEQMHLLRVVCDQHGEEK